uniref:cleavage and polyadenylation specificity factor subunit 1-like n=1 Tax=Styela clava TaxID=7725 RepID=UPI00193AD85A|nr:cleavage and polyadenylation specificity factor subunit 1-like [Styela clava]
MYAWYRQLHPPTGIENCLHCNFTSEKYEDLVVSAASQLTIYRLRKKLEIVTKDEKEKVRKDKLEQIGTWQLHGNIQSMKKVRFAGCAKDSILLSFKYAKLSVIEFDESTFEIKTSSLHYFEEDLSENGSVSRNTIPKICTDPENRCACMQLTSTNIAILPFRTRETAVVTDDSIGLSNAGTRGHVLSSYEINLKEVDPQVQIVKDMKFLHGYYEPTLLILFESLRTWAGRIAVRQDTCNIIAISLNVSEKLHPVIWSLGSLPYDCKYVYAVPKPIGGVLIFAVSSMIYLNQSCPPHGMSLNSHTKNSTSFPLKIQDGLAITLDLSKAVFLSPDRLVVTLKGGELYVISLVVDSMRSVRSFHIEKAAASVLTTCITLLEEGYLFLGSRLGNSLLLRYTEAARMEISREEKALTSEPASKRKRLNTAADWAAADDADDLEVYGRDISTASSGQLFSYTFEVCDSILNIGPCGSSELGEPALLSEEFTSQKESDLELVILSGKGKNGALSVVQRTMKPQVVTTFQLPGCIDMWTVKGPIKSKDESTDKESKEEYHGFLVLSREDSTLVLETGREIMEVEESGFCTSQSTIYVCNMCLRDGNKVLRRYTIQVCSNGIWLVEGLKQIQHVPLDIGSPIVRCSVSDPYALVLTEDGQVVVVTLQQEEGENTGKLYCSNPSLPQVPQVDSIYLYRDTSGMFVTNAEECDPNSSVMDQSMSETNRSFVSKEKSTSSLKPMSEPEPMRKTMTVDEEDELLYGISESSMFSEQSSFQMSSTMPTTSDTMNMKSSKQENEKDATYWAILVRANRNLEIYTVPNLTLVYVIKSFSVGHKLIVDSSSSHSFSTSDSEKQTESRYEGSPPVWEVMMVGFGHEASHPYLLARVGDELLIYEAFSYRSKSDAKKFKRPSLQLRFRKVDHGKLMRRMAGSYSPQDEKTARKEDSVSKLRYFSNIGGYAGVFICGPYPHWLLMTVRGALRCHPMIVDGRVTCFVPFHNINCPRGFLYFNGQGELRICVLPTHMLYDHPWPVRKVPVRCTPHFINYSVEHKIYALVTSVDEPCTRVPFMGPDGEREYESLDEGDRFIYPTIRKFSLELFSPVDWQIVPNTRVDLDEFEHVTCMCIVPLQSTNFHSSHQNYLCLGTANIMGEEMGTRGRILIFEIIEVVPEPGQPLTKNKLKKIYADEHKGPVTALCGVSGYLLAAIGQKMFVWRLDDNNSLKGVAFVDTQIYTINAFSFKEFALIADIQRSITLLRYKDQYKTLSVVSRDVRTMDVYATQLIIDGTSLAFLVSDREKNVTLFVYNSEAVESSGGTRLLRRADFHVGAHINTMWRVSTVASDTASNAPNEVYSKSQVTMFGTLDGAIGEILPVSEKIYRRLLMLQNAIVSGIQHIAGLNPKSFRTVVREQKSLQNPMRNILDGDLLWKFTGLSFHERQELARKIGTTADQILDDLMDIHRATCVM